MELFIADNLRLLRHKNGYTLEALAEIISVSRQSVAKWESGDSVPDIMNCAKLASLYKLSLDELVSAPIRQLVSGDFSAEEGRICGVVKIGQDGTVPIPAPVMEMFSFSCGDKLLLLADKTQGLALIKCSNF